MLHVQYIVNGTQEGITCAGVCLTYETESVETLVFENAIEKYDSMLLHTYAYIINHYLFLLSNDCGYTVGNLIIEWYVRIVLELAKLF